MYEEGAHTYDVVLGQLQINSPDKVTKVGCITVMTALELIHASGDPATISCQLQLQDTVCSASFFNLGRNPGVATAVDSREKA